MYFRGGYRGGYFPPGTLSPRLPADNAFPDPYCMLYNLNIGPNYDRMADGHDEPCIRLPT